MAAPAPTSPKATARTETNDERPRRLPRSRPAAPPAEVRVWDPFVRFFHGSLAALVLLAFLTGKDAERQHVLIGYAIVALIAARIGVGWLGWLLTTDARWGAEEAKEIHEVAAYGFLGMVGLHSLGVLWTSVSKGENLVRAMISGRKAA